MITFMGNTDTALSKRRGSKQAKLLLGVYTKERKK